MAVQLKMLPESGSAASRRPVDLATNSRADSLLLGTCHIVRPLGGGGGGCFINRPRERLCSLVRQGRFLQVSKSRFLHSDDVTDALHEQFRYFERPLSAPKWWGSKVRI